MSPGPNRERLKPPPDLALGDLSIVLKVLRLAGFMEQTLDKCRKQSPALSHLQMQILLVLSSKPVQSTSGWIGPAATCPALAAATGAKREAVAMQMRGLQNDELVAEVDLVQLEKKQGRAPDRRQHYYELTPLGVERCKPIKAIASNLSGAITNLLTVKATDALHGSLHKVSLLVQDRVRKATGSTKTRPGAGNP